VKSNLSLLEITLEESKPKQIERMLEAISCKFVSLKRTAFGPVTLKGLRKGQWREMTPSEIFSLKKSCTPDNAENYIDRFDRYFY
jgi:23S rRNA pseudouridine2605 synthase